MTGGNGLGIAGKPSNQTHQLQQLAPMPHQAMVNRNRAGINSSSISPSRRDVPHFERMKHQKRQYGGAYRESNHKSVVNGSQTMHKNANNSTASPQSHSGTSNTSYIQESCPPSPVSLVESVIDESIHAGGSPVHLVPTSLKRQTGIASAQPPPKISVDGLAGELTPSSQKSTENPPKSPLGTLRNNIKQGNTLFKEAKYTEAIEIWMRALQHVPHHKGLLHNVALAWDHLHQTDKAVLWLRKSAELGNKASMMVLGMALMRAVDVEMTTMNDAEASNGGNAGIVLPNTSRSIASETGTTNEEESVLADEEDLHDEAIKWFQLVYKECGGKISAEDMRVASRMGFVNPDDSGDNSSESRKSSSGSRNSTTNVTSPTHHDARTKEIRFWYQKAKKRFDAHIMRESQNEYHYHEHPELGRESILFSPASPSKMTRGGDSSSLASSTASQTPLSATGISGFSFVHEDVEDEDVEPLKGTNLLDKLNQSTEVEVETTTY
eukprot:CAMPEP_0117444564 /NCGR_PEP_ID=MMETSP0759-20121206/5308_1 /TAXON_ID=63605 /ORGANISM="Percolomonas cosmopolitus, Strain WS" /LENGTH=494 /DNA_ID=CAMNT_0005236639 /DNA_START=291 /DNA_END=1775 /DNA_ORIENTATION=+